MDHTSTPDLDTAVHAIATIEAHRAEAIAAYRRWQEAEDPADAIDAVLAFLKASSAHAEALAAEQERRRRTAIQARIAKLRAMLEG